MPLETLRVGVKGELVERWQEFLRGVGLYMGEVDGVFGEKTREATLDFQRRHGLLEDGIAGNRTFGEAMRIGFGLVAPDPEEPEGPEWPPKPNFPPLGRAGREAAYGAYPFTPAPTADNPEAIQITSGWVGENIVSVHIPQVANVRGASASGNAQFHRLVAPRVVELFQRWEAAGLLPLILTYGGSFVPRFIRGSRTTLSAHAHGSAFDINVAWNQLGAVPTRAGSKGSVRPLVPIANELGFYWGGHFTRRDGMHFELAAL